MNELLKGFLKLAESQDSKLSIHELLSEEEIFEWETLVKAFDSIDIMNVGKDLKKISKTYQLDHWQEMAILAYVKILELMIKRAKDAGALDLMDTVAKPPTIDADYSGSMFG